MQNWERDFHISRIVAGETPVPIGGGVYMLASPSRGVRLRASGIYRDLWMECHEEGVLTGTETTILLQARGLWMPEDESDRKLLAEKIDDMKVGIYELWSRSSERERLRRALGRAKSELEKLEERKHKLDHLTCEGIASSGRFRYLTGYSLLRPDGSPHWEGEADWERPDGVVDEVLEYLVRNMLSEAEFRELARTDPWRPIWSARERSGRGLFDAAACDLTQEQVYLTMWSSQYEGIRNHPDAPDDTILDDDDMTDGWMLVQKRAHDANRAAKRGDEIRNEKIRNADEVFVLANTVDDARLVEKMNSPGAAAIKAQRMAHIRGREGVPETEMPDTLMRMQAELARMTSEHIRKG
jgi:hypothetical protein